MNLILRINCLQSSGSHFDECIFPALLWNSPIMHGSGNVTEGLPILKETVSHNREGPINILQLRFRAPSWI